MKPLYSVPKRSEKEGTLIQRKMHCKFCRKDRYGSVQVGRYEMCSTCYDNALPETLRIMRQEKEPERKEKPPVERPAPLFSDPKEQALFTQRK